MSQKYEYDEKTNSYNPVDDDKQTFKLDNKIVAIILWAIQFLSSTFWPLVVSIIAYVYYKDKSKFVYEVARETLNFQISYFIYGIISLIISMVTFGFGMIGVIPFMIIYNIAIPVLGLLKASDNKVYFPHLTIRFLKD